MVALFALTLASALSPSTIILGAFCGWIAGRITADLYRGVAWLLVAAAIAAVPVGFLHHGISSYMSSYHYDPDKPFDPNYSPWHDIQGTKYEAFASRFAGAREAEDMARMKVQIDRELADCRVLTRNNLFPQSLPMMERCNDMGVLGSLLAAFLWVFGFGALVLLRSEAYRSWRE